MGLRISTIHILHPIKRKHSNKPHHLPQSLHQPLKLLLSPMIFIPIHKAHWIERKVDMGNRVILVGGVGNFLVLAEDMGSLVGGIEDVLPRK